MHLRDILLRVGAKVYELYLAEKKRLRRLQRPLPALLAACRAAGQVFGPNQTWVWHRDASGKTCAYLSVDATGAVQQEGRGAKADGRMATTEGMIYNRKNVGRMGYPEYLRRGG